MAEPFFAPKDVECKLIHDFIDNGTLSRMHVKGITAKDFLVWGDVVDWVVEYDKNYGEPPSRETLSMAFPDFPKLEENKVDTDFLFDCVKESKKKEELRSILIEASDMTNDGSEKTIDYLSDKIANIGSERKIRVSYADGDGEGAFKAFLERKENLERGVHVGIPTGVSKLDETLMGYLDGDFVVYMGPPEVGKCVVAETLVQCIDGCSKRIDCIVEEDRILCINEINHDYVYQKADLISQGIKEVYLVETSIGRQIKITKNHPLMTKDGWRKLEELNAGEKILVIADSKFGNGNFILDEITKISYFGKEETYDLSFAVHHNFVANGILVHNSWFLLNSGLVAYQKGHRVLMISLEMIHDELKMRWHTMLARTMGIRLSNEGLMTGKGINVDEYQSFLKKISRRNDFIIVDDVEGGACTVPVVEGLIKEFDPKLILIDSLPLMTTHDGSQAVGWQGLLEVAYALKFLANRKEKVIIGSALAVGDTFGKTIPATKEQMGLGRYVTFAIDVGISIAESSDEKKRNMRIFKKRKGRGVNDVFSASFVPNWGDIGS